MPEAAPRSRWSHGRVCERKSRSLMSDLNRGFLGTLCVPRNNEKRETGRLQNTRNFLLAQTRNYDCFADGSSVFDTDYRRWVPAAIQSMLLFVVSFILLRLWSRSSHSRSETKGEKLRGKAGAAVWKHVYMLLLHIKWICIIYCEYVSSALSVSE